MPEVSIAFFDAKPYDIETFSSLNQDYNYKIKFLKPHLNLDHIKLSEGFKVVCTFVNDLLNDEVLNQLQKQGIKLIALRCAGYNNVDMKAAIKLGLPVIRVPAYSPNAVAEHAVALMLCLNRKIHKAYYRTRDNNFTISGLLGFDMHGKTAGIIGTGRIGIELIHILKGFKMNLLAYDLYPKHDLAATLGFTYASLEEIYRNSDVISLHCPLAKETYRMINKSSIDLMKTGVMIINTGRGPLIETKALIEGLKSKKIGSAGLDVYEEESSVFFEDFSSEILHDDTIARLLTFHNVIVTSHQGFFTVEAVHNIAKTTLDNIKAYFEEDKLINQVQ